MTPFRRFLCLLLFLVVGAHTANADLEHAAPVDHGSLLPRNVSYLCPELTQKMWDAGWKENITKRVAEEFLEHQKLGRNNFLSFLLEKYAPSVDPRLKVCNGEYQCSVSISKPLCALCYAVADYMQLDSCLSIVGVSGEDERTLILFMINSIYNFHNSRVQFRHALNERLSMVSHGMDALIDIFTDANQYKAFKEKQEYRRNMAAHGALTFVLTAAPLVGAAGDKVSPIAGAFAGLWAGATSMFLDYHDQKFVILCSWSREDMLIPSQGCEAGT